MIYSIVLAAGLGKRMLSKKPKVLHKVSGTCLIDHALTAVESVTTQKSVVVIGHQAEAVEAHLGNRAMCVLQNEQLGTAHAVAQAKELLIGKTGLTLISYGDMPLLSAKSLQSLVVVQRMNEGPLSILTVIADDPRGFGRIIRNLDGSVERIVEESDASSAELQIKELNVGCYCVDNEWLWNNLSRIKISPKGEYYLTDIVQLAVVAGKSVKAVVIDDLNEAIGVNNRVHLAEAEKQMRERINRTWMLAGVTLIDPTTTYIDNEVQIGRDTIIQPNTYLHGNTIIGEDCQIGPGCVIRDTVVGNGCTIIYADTDRAVVGDRVEIGPFARLRKGAVLKDGVHMGNFGEVKDSTLSPGVKMGHFSYIGNAEIGENTNIGAGTITCNYDGVNKHKTKIGKNVFIGSDTMLVAPVELADESRTGAGSVVTKNVPENTLVVGVPARAIRKLDKKS